MASITVRDVPDEVRDELAARAARSGRSLQEYVRLQLVELTQVPDPAAWIATVRERKRHFGGSVPTESIIADLEANRR